MNQHENQASSSAAAPKVIGEFPCTQTQLRCWVLDQLQPGNPALNVAVRWEIRGSFKASTIEAAFRKIIQRHEILRTRFVERQGSPFQQVLETVDFKLSEIDLRSMPAEQREQRILSIGEETASAPFDLTRGGLFRVTLLMVENNRAFLLITAHQTCFDGWSIRVLGRELGEIASAIEAGRTPNLPDLSLQYGDFALWQQEYLSSYGFEAERGFWKETLKGAPYFEVPSDHPRPAIKTTNGNIISAAKPVEFGERIETAAREHKVSLFAYGVAIVSAVLHRVTGAQDILFGTQIAGREHSDLEPMIGVFINNMVLHVPVRPEMSFDDHLRSANQTVSAAVNHQRMPFNKLVEFINPVRDPSRNPLISVNFNLSKAFMEDRRYGDFELISAASQSPGVVYDISFGMVGRPSGWRMSIEYNTDLFDRATIERILQLWQDLYEQALSSPAQPLAPTHTAKLPTIAAATGHVTNGAAMSNGHAATPNQPVSSESANPADLSPAKRMALLGEIWATILDVEKVGPEGDFFALGGHSLLALRMLSAVRDRFGIKPELTLLFKEPTLKGFAEALFGPTTPEATGLPEISRKAVPAWECNSYKHGTGPCTVYTINHPFLYYQLANRLSDSISIHNVNMFGATSAETEDEASLEDVAAAAIRAMDIRPDAGPVGIMGLCVNGILALEVSRQLRQSGIDVAFTAAIDAWAPGYFRSQPWLRRFFWNWERRIKRATYFTRKLLTGRMKTITFLKEFRLTKAFAGTLGPAVASAEESANVRVTDFLVRTARNFKAQPVGDLMLFRSEASPARARKLRFGWGETVAGQASLIDLEGWHEDSLSVAGMNCLAGAIEERLATGKP